MSMRVLRSMGRGMIARPEYQTLIYVYPVTMEVSGLEGPDRLDTCFLMRLVERVTEYENRNCREGLSLKLQPYSPVLITQSIFRLTHYRVSLSISARISLSDQFLSLDLIQERRPMLVLAKAIDFAGSTVTLNRIHEITYSALNTSLGAEWREPLQGSIASRKTTRFFSVDWETPTGGGIQTISLMKKLTSG